MKSKPAAGLIFVISGPSGSGKTTILKKLIKTRDLKDKLARSVSFTTRAKRPVEECGKDYFFISERQFNQRQREKKLLEWTKYLGFYYATSKDFIESHLEAGRHLVLCLDLKGALKIKRLYPKNSVTIFIMPPSLGALRARIKKRGQKGQKEELSRRISLAKKELKARRRYDYCVANKDLGLAVKRVKDIILNKINT